MLRQLEGSRAVAETVARCRPHVVAIGGVRPDDAPRTLTIETVLLGGRTSGLSQFRELAREAGLEVIAAGEQPAGFVVECVEN